MFNFINKLFYLKLFTKNITFSKKIIQKLAKIFFCSLKISLFFNFLLNIKDNHLNSFFLLI